MYKRRYISWTVVSILLLAICWVLWQSDMEGIKATIVELGIYGYVFYVALLVASVVVAPFTVFPIIPFASHIFGPFVTGVLTVIGWTIGSALAFLLSRYAGRPLVARYVDLSKADAIVASLSPSKQFWSIVIMRHLMPVEVLSYALGLVPTLSFKLYLSASFLGVIWFSFAIAYLGEAALTGNYKFFVGLGLVSLAVFGGGWYLLSRLKKTHK